MTKSRFIVASLLSVSLILIPAYPSQAILGLGKCEKMTKQVKQSDQLIRELWKNYDKQRYFLKYGIEASPQLAGMMIDINQAILGGLKIMRANSNCFKVADKARLINSITVAEQNIASWRLYLKNPVSGVDWSTRFNKPPASLLTNYPIK